MSVRTLCAWETAAARPEVRPGRPPHAAAVLAEGREEVAQVCAVLGYTVGRRTVEPVVALPRRVVSAALRDLKSAYRAHERRVRAARRTHRIVLAPRVVEGQDSTHVGHVAGRGVWSEVARDWATLETRALGEGTPETARAFLGQLEARAAAGTLPLVLATDNGPAYVTPEVEGWLAAHQVIHLKNRPRTATDNGSTERAVGEAKAEAWLGAGVLLQAPQEGVGRMAEACARLNARPRPSRSGLSSEALTHQLPAWETRVRRAEFYTSCCAAIQCAVPAKASSRQRRQAEREAIFQTLERFGLMKTTRGEGTGGALKPEMIS